MSAGFIRGVRHLTALALLVRLDLKSEDNNLLCTRFLCYIGIAYQLPGAFAGERANGLTSHLKAMGLLDSARIWFVHILPCQIRSANFSVDIAAPGISASPLLTSQPGSWSHFYGTTASSRALTSS